MSRHFLFPRPDLAKQFADAVLGLNPLLGNSGLFMAAPRRTGKSTFLKSDLMPELTRRSITTVYVDLWADRSRDPADLISDAIKGEIERLDLGVTKFARNVGLSKVGLGTWAAIDVDKIGKAGGVTLADGISHLIRKSGNPVVLIIDEAQHALTSDAGVTAMFAVKSARDTLNLGADAPPNSNVQLGLVLTGSNSDKLASLLLSRSQPFYGSRVTDFPTLGADYVEAYVGFIDGFLNDDQELDVGETVDAFRILGFRPELLQKAVQNFTLGVVGPGDGRSSLLDHARRIRDDYWAEFDPQWSALTRLQKSVLTELIRKGDRYRPFEAGTLSVYAIDFGAPVTTTDVQSALEALREKGLIVRLERGRYTLEDQSMEDWFRQKIDQAEVTGSA